MQESLKPFPNGTQHERGVTVDNLRCFVAVDLDGKTRKSLAAFQEELVRTGANYKWVEPKHFHITLKFLGNVAADLVPAIAVALEKSLDSRGCFDISFDRAGAFPGLSNPKIVWVGIAAGRQELTKNRDTVEECLVSLGIPRDEHRFSPHLTLGRQRDGASGKALKPVLENQQGFSPIKMAVDRIVLMKSTLTRRGPRYEALHEIELVGD